MTINYGQLATTEYGNVLAAEHFADYAICGLWPDVPKLWGPAVTVSMVPGDNLMLHHAIYVAEPGSVIVVSTGNSMRGAVAGGNVCAIAQRRGIRGFVIDGVIRDLDEIKANNFPVYARGLFPVPGKKNHYSELNQTINCGGASVSAGDIVVADGEGIVFIPQQQAAEVFAQANAKFQQEQRMSLDEWQAKHETKVKQALDKARC